MHGTKFGPHTSHHTQPSSQQMKAWIAQHHTHRRGYFKTKWFQPEDGMENILSEVYFSLGNSCWIEDHSLIFGILYYRVCLKYIQFLLAHLPFQPQLNDKAVNLTNSDSHWIYSTMVTEHVWWDMQSQLAAWATLRPVVWEPHKTHRIKFSANRHYLPLYLTIGNIWKDICHTPNHGSEFWLGWSRVHHFVPNIQPRQDIMQLELY